VPARGSSSAISTSSSVHQAERVGLERRLVDRVRPRTEVQPLEHRGAGQLTEPAAQPRLAAGDIVLRAVLRHPPTLRITDGTRSPTDDNPFARGDVVAGVIGDLGPQFDAFVSRDGAKLLGFATLLTGDRGHAEDLVQTALGRTALRWRVAAANPEAFTRTVIVNLARDRWRRRWRRPVELPGLALAPEDRRQPAYADELQVLDREVLLLACRQLPVRQRAVLVLRFWEDRSVEETARLLGCTTGTVKSHTHRALARLRDLLTEPELEPGPRAGVPITER
jgi:RNA polymerase sigma-70 factor (sigma-E family)